MTEQEFEAAKKRIAEHAGGIAANLEVMTEEERDKIKALGPLTMTVQKFEKGALTKRVYVFHEQEQ